MDENEELPFTSPLADLGPAEKKVNAHDERDLSTLKQIVLDIEAVKMIAGDMNSIDPEHAKLSADQQLFAYQFALNALILPLERKVKSAIDKVEGINT